MSDFIQSGSFRRILVFLLTSLAAVLHRKFGIELTDADLDALTTAATVYIAGGNLKEIAAYIVGKNIKEAALAKGAEAAAKPSTIEEDAALLGGKVEERK